MASPKIRSPNPLVAFLDEAAYARGWSRERLSLNAGLSKDAIRSIENRGPRASANMLTIQKLASVLEIDVEQLVAVMPSTSAAAPRAPRVARGEVSPADVQIPFNLPMDLPVMGTAAGSSAGAFQITRGVVQYVRRPPALMTVQGAYSLFVENDSMFPKFSPGDLVFVNPNRPPAVGDVMIVQVQTDEHAEIESYIKVFVGRAGDFIVAEQYNPQQQVRFRRETVIATHRVIPVNELFGL